MFAQVKLMIADKFFDFHKKLDSQNDLEFRVRTALESFEHILPLDVQPECKNSKVSHNLRTEADKLFFAQKGNIVALLQAWEWYSKSIAVAENDSRELPLAYANRSAILFNLKKYVECIKDINRALELNYPDVLRANLLRRKAKCLKLLGKCDTENVCEEARCWLENIDLNDDNKEKLEQRIQNTIKTTQLQKIEKHNLKTRLPNMKQHKKIPCASNAIDIKYSKINGKYIVAKRDIEVGEILAIEKPYALLLKPECIYTHCSQCFTRAWDSIPCPFCVCAMYCSEKCRNEAWTQYHDIECPIKGYFLSLKMNDIAPLSLRLAVLAVREAGSIDSFRKQLKEIDNCNDYLKKGFSTEGIYRSDKYKALYCLETHEDKQWLPQVISMVLNVAVILYFVCTLTPFFGDNLNKSLEALSNNEDVIFIGKLIAHHYMFIQINDHELYEIAHKGHNHALGAVVFPFCSLFNHSCNPNAARIPTVGDDNEMYQVMLALHPIKRGDQIFDDYGFDFSLDPLKRRKELCKKYHFTCECRACKENWPAYTDLPSIFSIPASKDKKLEIKKAVNKITAVEKSIVEADIISLDNDSETVLKNLAQSVLTLFNYTAQPTKEFHKTVLLFRQAFLLVYGNKFKM